MTISLLRRQFNFAFVILVLSYGLAATSDISPAFAGKKVTALSSEATTVSAGSSVEVSVTINRPAPSKGGVIYLTSSDPSIATVPESVMVAPGHTSASFVVETAPSPNDSTIIISATYGAKTKRLTVIVNGVTPPAVSLSGLSVSPTSAQGGVSVQGTVTLSTSSPAEGTLVALTNGDPSLLGMPASIVVPGGASQASFTITTNPVSTATTIALSAVYAGVKKTALLTLQPGISGVLSTLSLSPASVIGGDGSQATVTLTAAAPSGGAYVTLTSSSPAATVPTGFTVPAGALSANFTIATSQVSVSTPVSISAIYNGVTKSAALTLGPAAATMSSVALNPTSVVGGNSSQGSVTLTGPAPSGGAVVSLASNNAAATVPLNVNVPAGSSSATFTVTTTQVSAPTSASISASYSGVTRSATLTIDAVPAALSTLTLNPTSVVGGNSSQGTVTLSSAAPSGGAVVSLSSNNAAATTPVNVTVPAGSSTATFTVNTSAVSSSTPVTISGVYSGVTRTASLTVNPVPAALSSIALNPTTVVGGNTSQGTVNLTAAAPSGGALVSLSSNNAAATTPVSVTVPAGSSTATFTVNTSAISSSTPVTISGVYSGVTRTAALTIDPVPGALSTLVLNPTSVVGGNSSQGTVTLSSAAPSGGAVVSLSSNSAAATTPLSVTVPAGSSTATFTVNTSAVSSSTPVTISGAYSGLTRTASLTVNPVPAALSSVALNPTTVIGGNSSQGTVTLTAGAPTGGAVVSLSSNNAAATVLTSVTVAAGSSTATFTVNTSAVSSSSPVTISGVYSGVTRTASLTVNPVPAALSSIALNPTTVVGGNSSQGTVTLTVGAPTGGAVVSLSSNNAVATVPTSVTVAAGSSTATFTVNTSAVSSSTPVTISGVYSGLTRTASLTVNPVPATLSSVALNPTMIVGGNSSQGTVTLTAAAPTGGAVVSLSSNNAVATVITSVTVAGGSSTATFTVNTSAVASSTPVTISGVYSGVTRTASLTVTPVPAALSSVALNPTAVVGGNTSQGTVTLTAAAATGGAIVSLSSNNAAATVLPSVTVAAGSSTATFTVSTSVVSSSTPVTISGIYSGVTRTASLTVNPVAPTVVLASLSLNPISILGGTSCQGTVTLTGAAPIGGASVSLSSTSPLIASTPPSITVLQGSTSATFTVNSVLVVSPLLVTISATYGGVTRGVGLTVTSSLAPTFYVAPNGSPSGNGSISQPWDLQTALNQPPGVVPGATIYLRGGTYKGKFNSQLTGLAGNVITVRSYAGEWAVIDGYVTTTLGASMNTTQTTLTLVNANGFPDGSQVSIADQADAGSEEQLGLNGKSGNSFSNVGRSLFGTPRLNHSSGATVVLGGNQLTISGSRCVYRDFEIKNSDPLRTQIPANSQNAPHLRGEGLFVSGALNSFANLVIHDCQEGVFIGASGIGSEVYGCIIYNNGYVAGGVHNGHGIYAIHSNLANTLFIRESLVFNNSSLGIKDDSQNGDAVNIWHEGDVTFNNGSWPQDNNRHTGLLAASNNGIADKITVKNCFFYLPAGHSGQQLKLGVGGADNGQATVIGNYIGGGGEAMEIEKWSPLVFTGNTVHATNNQTGNSEMTLYKARSGTPSVTWNNNTYWNQITGGGGYYPAAGSSSRTFTQWKSDTGFDAGSTQTVATTSAEWVSVRPNAYEPGRANIIVYNWTGASSVNVNVSSVLASGDAYSVFVAENYGSPVLTGTYTGGAIAIPMTAGTVAQPIGWSTTIATLRPTFGVFVIRKN